MLGALTILLVFQLVGEVTVRAFALPVPGPVIGMGLLFIALMLRGGPSPELRDTAGSLLQHLSLLFVPAGTGVILYGSRLADEWLPLTAALIGSTALTIIVTALLLRALGKRPQQGKSS